MLSTAPQLSKKARHELVIALGYRAQPDKECDFPHVEAIIDHWPRKQTLDLYVQLVLKIVAYFSNNGGYEAERNIGLRTIQRFIDDLVEDSTQAYFCDEPCESETRRGVITDTVLLILGSWSLMSDYFTSQRGEHRGVLRAYCWNTDKDYSETLPLEESLSNLVRKSGLLPNTSETITSTQSKTSSSSRSSETSEDKSLRKRELVTLHPSLGSVESLSITAASLNAFKLAHLGAIRILWTNNLSRHLLLSNHAGNFYLELFAMPSALGSGPDQVLKHTGIPSELMDEVCQSYANLFNPKSPSHWHIYLGVPLGAQFWCWCLSCASRRLRNSELRKLKSTPFVPKGSSASRPKFDSEVKILMDDKALGWDQGEFENLWPRIIALEVHLAQCKPWSFWVIFRDRRNSVQFWTFLFGTMILLLTFIQVALGLAQVVSGYK